MLLSFLGIYLVRGTFDFTDLASLGKNGLLSGNFRWLAFGGIFLGLAVKVHALSLPHLAARRLRSGADRGGRWS